jgi:hypothetical protein
MYGNIYAELLKLIVEHTKFLSESSSASHHKLNISRNWVSPMILSCLFILAL